MNRRDLLLSGAAVAAVAGAAATLRMGGPQTRQAAETFEVTKTDAEWHAILSDEAFNVLRKEGTEYPGTSPLLNEHRKGIFACAGCDLPVYSSETKFDSGTGWPSFWQEIRQWRRQDRGPLARHDPHRGPLPPLRRPSRPCLRRRSRTRPACATASTALR